MNISQKQKGDYIAALGIKAWFPRVHLANAKISIQYETESVAQITNEENLVIRPEVEATQAVPTTKSVRAADNDEVSANKIEFPQSSNPKNNQDSKSIRFGLALYVFNDWVVCSSLISDHQVYEASAAQLIQNILKVLGTDNPKLNHHHIISWPFFTNRNASQGVESASQYVNGVIEHLAEEHVVSKLLVCGGVLGKLNNWQTIEGQDFTLDRLIIPSIYKMLSDPTQKEKAWQIIQNSKYNPLM